ALEHLGNSCAARGKVAEALSAFQRALSIREKTLGAEHPSLRISRERIADLRLQDSEDSFDLGLTTETGLAPEKYRLLSGEPSSSTQPRAVTEPALVAPTQSLKQKTASVAPKERQSAPVAKKAPPPVVPERFADLLEEDESGVSALSVVGQSAAMTVALPHAVAAHSESAAYLNTLESMRDELE